MALVVSLFSHGGSVEHLRGEYPDALLDFFAEGCGEGVPNVDKDHLSDKEEPDKL